jgi:plastocyanin
MRRVALAAVVALLAVVPGAGAAGMPDMPGMPAMPGIGADAAASPAAGISIGFAAFATPHVDVVAGDSVRWTNDSGRAHDIVADDQSFDSGRIYGTETFTHRFETPGVIPYYCSLHPFMTGEIDVHPVLLDAPAQRAGSGKPYVLTGRVAAAGASSVAIQGDDGGGFAPVGSATVGADGSFRATVTPRTTTSYRALIDDAASPAVQLLVLDHAIAVAATRRSRATTLTVHVAPAAAGQTVVLQLRLRDRFGWWPVSSARLDGRSSARFAVPRQAMASARVLLTQRDGATELARSRTLHVGVAGRPRHASWPHHHARSGPAAG